MKKIFLLLTVIFCFVQIAEAQKASGRSKSGWIVPRSPHLTASIAFSGLSGGNVLTAGGNGTLSVTVSNTGESAAPSVSVALKVSVSPVGITFPSSVMLGDIAPSATAVTKFDLAASESAPVQSLEFSVLATDANRNQSESKPVTILVKEKSAPKDITPPTIEITEPLIMATRAMKSVNDTFAIQTQNSALTVKGIAKDPSGVAVVRLNDQEASLLPVDGGVSFSSTVLLTFGGNTVEIVALDKFGNRSAASFSVERQVAAAKEPEKPVLDKPFKGYQVWAAVIGISNYQNSDIPALRYADRDAEEFYQYLITPLEKGGRGVSKSNVQKLVNAEATKTNIQGAIFDFMKNAIEEDVAIIYFAGHGAPDPARPNVPYLLAYDSDLKRPAATAVKMSEIQDAIKDYIKARKVVVFADACHSAGVSGNIAMRGLDESSLINEFLEGIAKVGSTVLTFSASEAKEYSRESPDWGGGHGVFTYHILEGLKGKADTDNDGIVRLGELVDYVNQNVRRDTQSQQHPTASSTMWDRNLPMSIVLPSH